MTSRAIHESARHQDFVVLEKLLNGDSSLVHAQDDVGRSPLMMSALRGHVAVSSFLLSHGARIDQVDMNHRTALYNACSYGHLQVVILLLKRGADASIGDTEGNTPLIAAAYYGYEKVVRCLLDHKKGKDPDDLERKGIKKWTGLYLACESGHAKVAKMFLEVGSDPTLVDDGGCTPLDAAKRMYNWRCARLLEKSLREPQRVRYLHKARLLSDASHHLHHVAVDGKTRGERKRKRLDAAPPCLKDRVVGNVKLPYVEALLPTTLSFTYKRTRGQEAEGAAVIGEGGEGGMARGKPPAAAVTDAGGEGHKRLDAVAVKEEERQAVVDYVVCSGRLPKELYSDLLDMMMVRWDPERKGKVGIEKEEGQGGQGRRKEGKFGGGSSAGAGRRNDDAVVGQEVDSGVI